MKDQLKHAFILLAIFTGTNQFVSSQTNTVVFPSPAFLQVHLDSLCEAYVQENAPGLALLVAYGDKKLIAKGYGYRDMAARLPVAPSTNMRLASVSKQFTALCVLALVEQGKLRLDDTVYQYFPFDIFREVTVDQLIRHTSGIEDDAAFEKTWDTTQVAENKDLVAWYATNPKPAFKPGERWLYNNGAYEFLASLVEKVSGQDFASFAEDVVFKKAVMRHTHFFNLADPVDLNERSWCYEKDSTGNWQKADGDFMNGLLGAGAVYTSIIDYFNYIQALRNEAILSKESHQLIFRPGNQLVPEDLNEFFVKPFKGKPTRYGMGWFVADGIAAHGGGWVGTTTYVHHELDRPLTIAIFTNSNRLFDNDLIDRVYAAVDAYLQGVPAAG